MPTIAIAIGKAVAPFTASILMVKFSVFSRRESSSIGIDALANA